MKMPTLLYTRLCGGLILIGGLLLVGRPIPGPILAQAEENRSPQVQNFEGSLEIDQAIKYVLPDLHVGDVLYIYVSTVSGNFDPFIGVADPDVTLTDVEGEIGASAQAATASGSDPIVAIDAALERVFLSSNDDGGTGYDAALSFNVPDNGDYALVLRSSFAHRTFGAYSLLIGLNAPGVLSGVAESTGATLAVVADTTQPIGIAIQEITDTLSMDAGPDVFHLNRFSAGDTLYVYVEATEGDLHPIVLLQDFVGKSIRSTNIKGDSDTVTFEYTFTEDAAGYQLILSPTSATTTTSGSYLLLVGVNEPEVLTGTAEPTDQQVFELPTLVSIWLEIDQVSNVDQRDENFTVVGSLYLRWNDPARAFRPDECGCAYQAYFGDDFNEFTRPDESVTWPEFVIFNQEGRRETQLRGAAIASDGTVTFTERFTVILQAPDFDFRLFPFDSQVFYIRIDMLYNDDRYVFVPAEERMSLGNQPSEEEFIFQAIKPSVQSEDGVSRFILRLESNRNITYYLFRVILPIVLIIIVTWVTFFLGDFVKRVDVAGANLLVFVAFNFTVSDDLPRLGYLTLLDTLLISTFAVTSLIIVLNVYLQWLTKHHQEARAQRLDRVAIWGFPLGFVVLNALLILFFVSSAA